MLEESVSSPTFWAGLNSWFTPTVFFLVLQLVIGTIFITSTLANNGTHKHHEQQQQDPQGNEYHHPQQPLARSPSMLQRLKSINFYSYPYRSQDPHQHTPDFQTHLEGQHHHPQPQTQLPRSPSMIQRLKSINLYSYLPTEPFSSFKFPTDTNVVPHETSQPQKPHVHNTTLVETYKEREDHEEEEYEDDDVVGQIHDNLGVHEEGGSSMDEIFSQLLGQGGHFARTQSDTKPASGEVPVKLPRKMKKSASAKSAFSHFKEDDIVESRRPATVREAKVTGAAVDDDEVDAKADDFINKFKHQLKLQRNDSIMSGMLSLPRSVQMLLMDVGTSYFMSMAPIVSISM